VVAATLVVRTMFTSVILAEENFVNVPDVADTTVIDKTIFGFVTRIIMNLAPPKNVSN